MAISTVVVTVTKTSELGGGSENASSGQLVNASAPEVRQVLNFMASTFGSCTVPSGATGVYIIPPISNTGLITLKGVTGDAGINIHKTQPTFLSIDSSVSSFGLLCAATINVEFLWT